MSPEDLLDAVAPLLRVRPVLEDFCQFGGAWRSCHPRAGKGRAQFHIVTRGICVIERRGAEDLQLSVGDVLLLPHGDGHIVRSRAGGMSRPIVTKFRNAIRLKTTVGAKPDTELICGQLLFAADNENALVTALPGVILIPTLGNPLLERFRSILMYIRDELDAEHLGSTLIASNLASALLVMILRLHLERTPVQGSVLSLLQNRSTAKVVLAVLREPARNWTLDDMAAAGFTTRATLVRTFRKACGLAPMAYINRLRLDLAHQALVGTDDSISTIAAAVGYRSESSLSRAFLRRFGVRPGAVRVR